MLVLQTQTVQCISVARTSDFVLLRAIFPLYCITVDKYGTVQIFVNTNILNCGLSSLQTVIQFRLYQAVPTNHNKNK
jgi:hypothetical protein